MRNMCAGWPSPLMACNWTAIRETLQLQRPVHVRAFCTSLLCAMHRQKRQLRSHRDAKLVAVRQQRQACLQNTWCNRQDADELAPDNTTFFYMSFRGSRMQLRDIIMT